MSVMKANARALAACVGVALALSLGCQYEFIPRFLGGGGSAISAGGTIFPGGGGTFAENLIQARTFTDGTAVTTVTYLLHDLTAADPAREADVLFRTPYGIDFNSDGKIDPVVGYGKRQAVIQILLSDPDAPPGVVRYTSLTLDSKRDMENLADVAVGDIDGDGALDIVAAAKGAIWYFRHPSGQPTTALAAWGNPDPNDELRERIDASFMLLTDAEIQAIITQAIGPGVNLDDYIVTVEQLYTNVELGDMDNDGDNDIVASRSFILTLTPKPDKPVEPLQIVDGDVLVFINPGFATDGRNWTALSVGKHERQQRLDRDGATDLVLYDIDGDGDLDIISAARRDNNVQVVWFENPVQNRVRRPGSTLALDQQWTQWRIGSIRDAWGIAVADLTGDGRPDVVATGGEQMQMVLFEQPATGPARSYDWDTYVLATYQSHEPRDVLVFDVDNDGELEIVTGGTAGAIRYYKNPGDPRDPWEARAVVTFDPPGDVGRLGWGDLDGDGDLDLVAVVAINDSDLGAQIVWIRNDLVVLSGGN